MIPFQQIRRLQIKALRHVNDLFAGSYRSAFKGKGMEFEDVREYQPGDDIRTIDWNVTARSQNTFVKNFREERELTVMLVVDISASSHFSHTDRLKSEMIAELGSLLAFSAIKNQDKVGLLLFTNEVELYLSPKKGIRHVLRVIRELLYFQPKHKGTNLNKALAFLGLVQKKRTICFLISDFLIEINGSHDDQKLLQEAAITAKRHELIAFHIFDTHEQHLFSRGLFRLKDLETDVEAFVDTSHPAVQQQFQKTATEHSGKIKRLFERMGADYLSMNTEESSDSVLRRFFRLRGNRR